MPALQHAELRRPEVGFNRLFFRQFHHLHKLLFPGVSSIPFGLFALLLIFCLLEQFVIYNVGLIPSKFYKVLGDRDQAGFINNLFLSIGIIIAIALVRSTKQYISNILSLTWRQLLTRAIHRLYFSGINYYQLNVLDCVIDNPDQRITQDVERLCSRYGELAPAVIIAPFTICYYSYKAYSGTGWIGPTSIFAFFILSTFVNKMLMSPIARYIFEQERKEGDFRFKHMQIRVQAEALAFHSAGHVEASKTNARLESLLGTQKQLISRQYFLSIAVGIFDYLGSILSYIAIAIPIFAGRYDDLSTPELSALISANAFVCIYLISCFSSLVDISNKASEVAGLTFRVSELLERLQQLAEDWRIASQVQNRSDITNVFSDVKSFSVEFDHACFTPPYRNKELVRDLNLKLNAGKSVLLVGSSSAGKTSLLRILRGLWPLQSGSLTCSFPPGPSGIFFLPQKPYFTDGTLREQIVYPLRVDKHASHEVETDRVLNYLHQVNMSDLLDRTGGLDEPVEWNWPDVLSPGEMQRLCFVRMFYHRPLLACLDEATSALSMDMELVVYNLARSLGITVLSVGHRESLRQFHDYQVTLDGEGGWSVEELKI